MRYFFILLLVVTILSGCQGKRDLTPEELTLVAQLRTELTATDADISSATKEDENVTGGLLKALIATKLEILKTNKALLQQRINAVESGAQITVSVPAYKPDAKEAERLAKDIESQINEIKSAREDAGQYSGGLVLAMKLSAIATQEQTLAMLKQRQLVAKYGLAHFVASASNNATTQENSTKPDEKKKSIAKASPADGPFGFKQGLTRTDVESMVGESITLLPGSKNAYLLSAAPKPHNAFESYVSVIGDVPGLCVVRGIGKDITSSRHGIQLKTSFNELEATISELYGPSEKTDQLLSGSIWREPENWMMGLAKEERFLFAQWPRKGQALKNELENITLAARAKSGDTGFLILEYSFKNNEQCSEESKSAEKSSL
ncbi:hypothetical protein FACS1894185_7060 [Betaproteobacteria bacterium]|nr:hypothetical protein FACS1894185_7060 [Betaproteobacteria bacterium]